MMSDRPKFPRDRALVVAREICQALKPITERLIVAGSLRRGKVEVGDIEIVYVPKFALLPDPNDLLQHPVRTDLVEDWLARVMPPASDFLRKRPNSEGHFTWGAQNKLAVHVGSGIPVDFFASQGENYWTLLVCRTGSRENNERICNAAIARGLKWDPYHGFRDRVSGELLAVPRSEREVFTRVGLPYLAPGER